MARPARHALPARRAPPRRAAERARADVGERLSERELEVLLLIAGGSSNAKIARALHVSERTVKGHVGGIFARLGPRDRAAAIVLA